MAQFKNKPKIIEAEQLTAEMERGEKPLPNGVDWHDFDLEGSAKHLGCITIHGQKTMVQAGDWIIREPDGIHYYPCKPDIFEATYDPYDSVKDDSARDPA